MACCCEITTERFKRFARDYFGWLFLLIAVLHLFMGGVLAFAIFVTFGFLEMLQEDYSTFFIAFVPALVSTVSLLISVIRLNRWANEPRQYYQAPLKDHLLALDAIPTVRFRRPFDEIEFLSNRF